MNRSWRGKVQNGQKVEISGGRLVYLVRLLCAVSLAMEESSRSICGCVFQVLVIQEHGNLRTEIWNFVPSKYLMPENLSMILLGDKTNE